MQELTISRPDDWHLHLLYLCSRSRFCFCTRATQTSIRAFDAAIASARSAASPTTRLFRLLVLPNQQNLSLFARSARHSQTVIFALCLRRAGHNVGLDPSLYPDRFEEDLEPKKESGLRRKAEHQIHSLAEQEAQRDTLVVVVSGLESV